MGSEKIYLTWEDVEDYVQYVNHHFKDYSLSGVYGLPRGGLCLAVMISHCLGIPLLMAPTNNCLIVDDICDSGESLLHYYCNSSSPDKPTYIITTMIYNPNKQLVVPDFYWKRKIYGDWIVFPWECIGDKEG